MSPENPRFASPETDGEDKKNSKRKKNLRFVPATEAPAKVRPEHAAPRQRLPSEALETILGKKKATPETADVPPTTQPKEEQKASLETDSNQNLPPKPDKTADNEKASATASDELESKEALGILLPETSLENDSPAQQAATAEVAVDDTVEVGSGYAFPTRELDSSAGELGTGEGIIHLTGQEAAEEHTIPLHDIQPLAAPAAEVAYSAYSRQPEQQHRAGPESPAERSVPTDRYETVAPTPETASGDSGGTEPPADPPEQAPGASPDEPERSPSQADMEILPPTPVEYSEVTPDASASVSPSERPATKQELDEAFARSAMVHERRGLLSGLFVGTLFANRRLRRNQRRTTKQLQKQGKQIEQLQKTVSIPNQERQSLNQREFNVGSKRFENNNRPPSEKMPAAKKTVEQAPRAQQATDNNRLELSPDRHLETSAWHAIEVDNKTGKLVENPTFEYGHEYYQERSHESGPKDQRNALAGEVAIIAATGASVVSAAGDKGHRAADDTATKSTNHKKTGDNLPDKAKAAVQSLASALKSNGTSSQAGPIWPWALALLAIIIVLALLIN